MIIKQGMIGVGSLHQQLLEAGETIEQSELDSGFFGPSTLAAVRHFQASHIDEKGRALQEDGAVGPSTIWALIHPNGGYGARLTAPGWRAEPSVMRDAVRPVMLAAIGEIGTREEPDGTNSGPRVDLYTAPQRGIFWCAAFASWCYAKAEAGSPFGRFTASWQFYEWGKKNGRLVSIPSAGDVGIMLRGDPKDHPHGHTWLVAGLVDDNQSTYTVEGNAGNAVRGLIRPIKAATAFIRPIPIT